MVDLPLGATEDRVCGTIDIEKALTEGVKAFEPGLLVRTHPLPRVSPPDRQVDCAVFRGTRTEPRGEGARGGLGMSLTAKPSNWVEQLVFNFASSTSHGCAPRSSLYCQPILKDP